MKTTHEHLSTAERKRRFRVRVNNNDEIRKLVVMVPESATIQELSQEVISRLGLRTSLVLEVSDGYELPDQDAVSIIGEEEIITARAFKPNLEGSPLAPTHHQAKPHKVSGMIPAPPPYVEDRVMPETIAEIPKRFRVKLINPRLAREHAAQHPRDLTMPKGLLAFGGAFVSGNTNLWEIKCQAAKLFHWYEVVDEQGLGCHHESDMACSCTIAEQVEQYGAVSMLYCRLQMVGGGCNTVGCAYSHTAAHVPGLTATCPLCMERLGSPCLRCKISGVGGSCPLMQNAGCYHWSHAHCLQEHLDSTVSGCPSGCEKELYPREAISFTEQSPHILLVWGGNQVDRLTISDRYRSQSLILRLSQASIQDIVEQFLRSKDYAAANLCMRIHRMDRTTKTVSFYNSTLVSVCASSAHNKSDLQWFNLFDGLQPTSAPQRTTPSDLFLIDLHTEEAPITSCGCTTIGEIFSDHHESDFLVLYATKRRPDASNSAIRQNKEVNFVGHPSWHPEYEQTPRGLSSFLSSLFVLSTLVPKKGVVAENTVLATLFSICRFPPAVRTLGRLFLNEVISPWEKAPLSEALFYALMDYHKLDNVPNVIQTNPRRTFEIARPFLAQLYRAATQQMDNTSTLVSRLVEEVSVACPFTQRRLKRPIVIHGVTMETDVYALYDVGGQLTHICDTINQTPTPPPMTEFSQSKFHQVVLQSQNSNSNSVRVLNVNNLPSPCLSCIPDLLERGTNFSVLIDEANLTDLKVLGPLSLNSSSVVPPQLVLDERGYLAVLTDQRCGVNFLMPIIGEATVEPQEIAQALEPRIKIAEEEGTWEIDAFDKHGLITRDPDEAIMICLDLSGSMNSPSQVLDPKNRNTTPRDQECLTRLQLVVELFNVLVNRASSFNSSTSLVIGLITFSSRVKVVQDITPVFKNFLQVLKNCRANGSTPLYDALDRARQLLVEFGSKHPLMRKRIIVVSDGEDTSSTLSPWVVAGRMYADGVIVDSVQVGRNNREHASLHAISACTGGYRFRPNKSLDDALCIFDLETVLDSSDRPARKPTVPNIFSSNSLEVFKDESRYPVDPISVDNFPKRLEHPKMNQGVVQSGKIKNRISPDMRLRRIMTEIRDWNANPHHAIDIYVNDTDITFMKIVVEAPWEDCIYRGGTFLLTCQFPEGYPRNPPEIRFATFILHPNVSKQGKICIAELGRLWSSDITLKQALSQIYGLLMEPEVDDSTETQATLKYYEDDGTYALAVANAVDQHASKTRGEWKRELDADSNMESDYSLFGRAQEEKEGRKWGETDDIPL